MALELVKGYVVTGGGRIVCNGSNYICRRAAFDESMIVNAIALLKQMLIKY